MLELGAVQSVAVLQLQTDAGAAQVGRARQLEIERETAQRAELGIAFGQRVAARVEHAVAHQAAGLGQAEAAIGAILDLA